jgi:hypothetical protein
MAMAGWVSFNWTTNFSGKRSTPPRSRTVMRIMSCSEQEVKKYCWRRRSLLPATGSSLG